MDIAKLLDRIPQIYHPRIMLHRFPELLKDYKLAGYHHFSGEKLIDCQGLRSRSLHKLDELRDIEEPLDYCFFGPVYESISKKDTFPKYSYRNWVVSFTTLKIQNHKSLWSMHWVALGDEKFQNFSTWVLTGWHYSVRSGEKRTL